MIDYIRGYWWWLVGDVIIYIKVVFYNIIIWWERGYIYESNDKNRIGIFLVVDMGLWLNIGVGFYRRLNC